MVTYCFESCTFIPLNLEVSFSAWTVINFNMDVKDFDIEEQKLYTCFEATNDLGEPVYVISSAKISELHDKQFGSTPLVFKVEVVIKGLQSMGCGVFGSKIVLAGGLVTRDEDKIYRRGMITYDTKRKLVSYVDIPPMQGLKIRPVVIELHEIRLYVLNTSTHVHRRSFEIYYPTKRFWDALDDPYLTQNSGVLGNKKISGRTPYSWFVFGNCLCISSPKGGPSHIHHARTVYKFFMSNYDELLPFRGMATTYWHPDFSDVVVIYLSQEGVVEGRRLNIKPHYFGEPEKIFETVPFKPDGELSSYFADFGYGNFCLTVFDNVIIHVYMFTIVRLTDKENGALNFELKRRVDHKYRFSDFFFGRQQICQFPRLLCTANI